MPVEPFVSADRATARSLGNVLDGGGSHYMIVGWLATDAWITAHPDVAARFTAAIAKAAVWANSHEKESAAILVRNSRLDPAVADSMARAVYGTKLDPSLVKPVVDAAVKYGIIDKPVPTSDLIWTAPK